ncbi:olfactory receptor 2T29-like [Gastrophryne carolinensis]
MGSNTSLLEFHILPFFMKTSSHLFLLSIIFFFLCYSFGILLNLTLFSVICVAPRLHTPMYLFLCNLSVVDMLYTTVTVPNLLYILISGNNTLSSRQCFIQMYCFFIAATSEITLIFIMAYDRYVAICHPLHYHHILNKKICVLFMAGIWVTGCVNSYLLTESIFKMFFCSSPTIRQFFCDAKALINIACGGQNTFYILVYLNCFVLGFGPVLCNVVSYVKIIKIILAIKSKDARSKAFSTCSSHLTLMIVYYGSAISVYMIPPSESHNELEQVLTVFYTTVIPMVNPLIYSLRNKDVKRSLRNVLL